MCSVQNIPKKNLATFRNFFLRTHLTMNSIELTRGGYRIFLGGGETRIGKNSYACKNAKIEYLGGGHGAESAPGT